jgi:hypothetical protein
VTGRLRGATPLTPARTLSRPKDLRLLPGGGEGWREEDQGTRSAAPNTTHKSPSRVLTPTLPRASRADRRACRVTPIPSAALPRQDYATRMKEDGVSRAIVVVQQHMTPFARQSLLETERSKYHIEQFHEQARARASVGWAALQHGICAFHALP